MNRISRHLLSLVIAASLGSVATGVLAAPHDDIDARLAGIEARIDHGHMPPPEARRLHDEARSIRDDEHHMAANHHGHLDPSDMKSLDHRVDALEHELDHH